MKKRKKERCELVNYPSVLDVETQTVLGVLADISENGMRIESAHPLPAGHTYTLLLEIGPEKLQFEGKALWTRQNDRTRLYNTGVEVLDLPEKTVKYIQSLIYVLKTRDKCLAADVPA